MKTTKQMTHVITNAAGLWLRADGTWSRDQSEAMRLDDWRQACMVADCCGSSTAKVVSAK